MAAGSPRPCHACVELGRRVGGRVELAPLELGLHHDGEQLRHPETVGRHQPQPAAGRGARQVEVAALQQQPGRRQQGMDAVVPAQQQRLCLVEPPLEQAQLGQRDRRVVGRAGHDLEDEVVGAHEHLLGLAPAPEVAQQGGSHAVAVAGQEQARAGLEVDDAALAEGRAPRRDALEVGRVAARCVERADRLGQRVGIVRAARAGQGHRLVEHLHALDQPAGLHQGQAGVGQRLDLEVDVAEAPSPLEGIGGPLPEHVGVVHLAADHGDGGPALLHAGLFVLHEPHGPGEPGAGGDPVAQHVVEEVAEAGRGQRGGPVVAVGREPAHRRRQLDDGGVEVAGLHGLVGQPQRGPTCVVHGAAA